MTVMKHKSADERRQRRQRYKNACKPIMERFGCTSRQVAGLVVQTYRNNEQLKAEVEKLEKQHRKDREEIKALEAELGELKMGS